MKNYTLKALSHLPVRLGLVILLLFAFWAHSANAQTAKEIIQKMDEKMQGNSNISEMTMQIIRPSWKREISIKGWSLGTEYSLILVTAPARDKGTAFLKRDMEMWNWQPTIDRVVKLPPSMMMQSWMGSDFTNDDLVRQSSIVNDFTHTIVKDTTISGYPCWKLQLIPKEEAAVVWGKIETYVAKGEYFQLLVKYYDEDDYLINTMVLSDVRDLGGRVIPAKLEMIPAENPDQKTVITYKNMQFNVAIEPSFFSQQNMKKVK